MQTMRTNRSERGAALLEAAITIPMLLLIAVGIFEFGRAYQTWQVLTNAAREGARVAVLPDPTPGNAEQRVLDYLEAGQLNYDPDDVDVVVNRSDTITVNGAPVSASRVTVDYPFQFMVLGGVVKLVSPQSDLGDALTMRAEAVMRNENQ
jgi:Flp pilus assembly protein TadG